MRRVMATVLGVVLATLSVAGVGHAQGVATIQGTIAAVDCQSNVLVLNTTDGTQTVPSGPYTSVFVNGTPTSFCALQPYTGSAATVSVGATGNQLVAQRIDVSAAAQAPVYPAPAPAPAPAYSGLPTWLGVAIGSVVVGGLLYLLVRGHDGHQYQYPYNGYYNGGYSNGRYYGPGYYNGGRFSGQTYRYPPGYYSTGHSVVPGPAPVYPECTAPGQQNCHEPSHGN
jgi:hypothetical protein